MYNTGKILFLYVYFMSVTNVLVAQDHVIHGIVHCFDSIPLIGAEIIAKSTKQSVLTDSLGNFAIPCNSKDKLKIKAKDFSSVNVKVTDQIKIVAINLKLKPGVKQPSKEIREYAIGYGHVSEQDKTTATESLRKNEASFSRYSTVFEMIQGQFAGVEVRNDEILIRGNDSFNLNSAALIVVDGVIMESDILRTLRPMEVKNIHVIKDGSAAVYGSRGANGVVIIETRKGGDVYH